MGKAYSIRLALSVARGDYFVILDGDGELDPVGVKSLAKTMIATNSDFVNGTRVIKDLSKLNTRSNFISRVAKKLTTLAILIVYGIHIKDSLSGYKKGIGFFEE